MLEIRDPLFLGKLISLSSIDHEKDADIETKWTHDPEYMRMLHSEPYRPLSAAQLKKRYEAIEKEQDEHHSSFYFTIRSPGDDRLIGFIRLNWVDWPNGNGNLELGIGNAGDRRHGYGTEALQLLIRYAFSELNLFRLSVIVGEYNQSALQFILKAGFSQEVVRRQAYNRDGRRWDAIHLGFLRSEWLSMIGERA